MDTAAEETQIIEPETTDQAAPLNVEPTEEALRADAKLRAEACNAEVQAALGKYSCRIAPMLTSEPVGTGPSTRMLIGATYGILPDPLE